MTIINGRDSREEQILWEQVKQLYSLAPLGIFATLVNAVIVFFVMKEVVPSRIIVPWLAALLTASALRIALSICFRRAQPEMTAARAWKTRFLSSLALIGVVWGSIGMVPFSFPIAYQVFLAFVLGGMAAGASSTFSKVRYGYAVYSFPAMMPLALHFFLIPDAFHRAMGAMTLLYAVMLSRIAWQNYAVNRSSLLLRFENQEMIEGLKRAKEEVETLNAHLVSENNARLEAEAKLRVQHEHLERIVKERTAELVRANLHLRASKDAAEAGNAVKSEFLANMSHEMRTPLAGVLGMIKLVLDMEIGAEERELLGMAQRSAGSLLRIIADVLDFSRLEAGMMSFERKPFSLAQLLSSAAEVVSSSARERGLQLGWKVEDGLPDQLEGDAGRLRQVLVNLLGNAVKFTQKGAIELTARRYHTSEDPERRFIIFSVKDTGVGIPADQLEHIFEKFTQIDASLTKRYGGTGLGLALSRQIVEKMGGRIWAESSAGLGSTFHFTVPEHPAAEA